MRKVLDIMIVLFLFVVLSGFQKMDGAVSSHGDMGEIAGHDGIAVDVIVVEGYTYVELEANGVKTWIAAPTFKVEKGDRVLTSRGIEMKNFASRKLGRSFPVIWFVQRVEVVGPGEAGSGKAKIPKWQAKKTVASPKMGSIKKAEGGYSLEELFDKKGELAGKEVKFRAMVVKASGNIMGNEWYHVQDGTGSNAVLDLIVTSKNKIDTGSTVLVVGTLAVNRDFGSGYRYAIIVENASLKVE